MWVCRLHAVGGGGKIRHAPASCQAPPARIRSGSWEMHSGTLRKMDIGAPRSHNLPGRQEDTGETRSSKKLSPISLGFGPLETHFKLLGDKETRFRRKVLPQGAPGEGRVRFSENNFFNRYCLPVSPELKMRFLRPKPPGNGRRTFEEFCLLLVSLSPRKSSGLGPPTP